MIEIKTHGRPVLAQARIRLNLTQKQFCKQIGIGLESYREIERGNTRNPQKRFRDKITELIGIPESEWLQVKEYTPTPENSKRIKFTRQYVSPDDYDPEGILRREHEIPVRRSVLLTVSRDGEVKGDYWEWYRDYGKRKDW